MTFTIPALARRTGATVLVAVLLAVLSGLLIAPPAQAASGDDTAMLRILRDTNRTRAERGLGPLYRNGAMDAVASAWSGRQAAANSMSHNPDFSRQIPGGWSRAGENVAYGYQPQGITNGYAAVVEAWRNSPGHLANLVGDYTDIGIGIAYASNGYAYYTQNFGKYQPGASAAAAGPGVSVLLDGQYVDSRTGMPSVPPVTGDLVKSAGDDTVYLVDSDTRKIPVPSFDLVNGLGLSGVKVVGEQYLGARTTDAPLSPLVSCAGVTYLGSEGIGARIDAVTGFRATPLSAAVCARIRLTATAPIGRQFTLRTPDGSISTLRDGVMRRATTWPALVAALGGTAPQWLPVGFGTVAALPRGGDILAPNSLVKGPSDPTVYWVDGFSGRIRVPSFDFSTAIGATGVTVVSDAALSGYTASASPLSLVLNCPSGPVAGRGDGVTAITPALAATLGASTGVSASGCAYLATRQTRPADRIWTLMPDGGIWSLSSTGMQRASTWAALLEANAGTAPTWSTLSWSSIGGMSRGTDLLSRGELIRTADDPQVWLVDGAVRVPVDRMDVAVAISRGDLAVVSDETVRSLTAAGRGLGVVVTDGSGSFWIAGAGVLHRIDPSVIGNLPVTTLSPAFTASMTQTDRRGSAVVYLIDERGVVSALSSGKIRRFSSWAQLASAVGDTIPTFIPTAGSAIAAMPTR